MVIQSQTKFIYVNSFAEREVAEAMRQKYLDGIMPSLPSGVVVVEDEIKLINNRYSVRIMLAEPQLEMDF